MYKTFLVALREFLAAVLTKGFLLGILLPPVIGAVAILVVPLLMNSASPKTKGTIAVIDRSQSVSGTLTESLSAEAFKARRAKKLEKVEEKMKSSGLPMPMDANSRAMTESAMEAGVPTLSVEVLPFDADAEAAKKPILKARVKAGDDADPSQRVALIVIPDSAVHAAAPAAGETAKPFDGYQMFVAPKLDIDVQRDISDEVDKAIVDARLKSANFDPGQIHAMTANPKTDTKVVTSEGERSDNGFAAVLLPGAFLILLWISVLVGGQGLLMSTVEEKSSRVMEVLLSAVSPIQLMVGKIVGQMAVAAVILSLYSFTGIGALIAFRQSHLIEPMVLVYFFIYFVIAFFLMASMMAAVGSAVNDIREAQALMQPIMFVLVIPMMLWMPIGRNPNGLFAKVVSFIPPISPFVMVTRLAGSEPIPFWQVPVSIGIGILAMIFMGWATAKIFRLGVLMYGKPPNLRTLIKWVRMA